MQRFLKNRWTLILALCVGLACGSNRLSAADDPSRDANPDPVPQSNGDPDLPGGKTMPSSTGTQPQRGLTLNKRVVGDVHAPSSDVMWRLFLVWRGLRATWFRF